MPLSTTGPVTGAATDDIKQFTTSGTWSLPSGWTTAYVEVWVQGAGAGAGSGTKNTAGSIGGGGGGGGAGELKIWKGIVNANQTVTIGAKGTGGAGITVNGGGNDGTAGGTTSFGSLVSAVGGNQGRGGINLNTQLAAGGAFASSIAAHGPSAQASTTSMAGGTATVIVEIDTVNTGPGGDTNNGRTGGYGAYVILSSEDATATGVGDVDIIYALGTTGHNSTQVTFTRGTTTGTININYAVIDPTPATSLAGFSGPGGGSCLSLTAGGVAGNAGYSLPGFPAASTGGTPATLKGGGGGGGSSYWGSGGNGSNANNGGTSSAGGNGASYGAGGGGSGGSSGNSGAGGDGVDGYCLVFAWKAS